VKSEAANSQADAEFTLDEARRRVRAVKDEQAVLMKAHYAGAVPVDVLKTEMERTTRELEAAGKQTATAARTLKQTDEQLERALNVARLCREQYATATDAERRLVNQGLFKKMFIAEDGSVEEAEVQDIFAGILSRDETVTVEERDKVVVPVPQQTGETVSPDGPDGRLVPATEWGTRPERRWSPSAVLLSAQMTKSVGQTKTPRKLSFSRGSHKTLLAETEGFEPSQDGHGDGYVPRFRGFSAPTMPTESDEKRQSLTASTLLS
jgi:hypothetical protein